MLEADILERTIGAYVASPANGGGSEGADDQAPRGCSPR